MTDKLPSIIPKQQPAEDKLTQAIWQDPALTEALGKFAASQPTAETEQRTIRSSRMPFYAMAASLLVCILSFALSWHFPMQSPVQTAASQQQSIQYTAAEIENIDLSDGSHLTLNRQTQLTFVERDDSRDVIMTRGEAYFDVARNEQKPFNISLGEAKVTVLGTRFNINRTPNKIWIDVYHGRVAVEKGDERIELTRGQRAILSGQGLQQDSVNGERPGWQDGWLDLDNVDLHEATYMLSRYSDKPIVIDQAPDSLKISGRFQAEDIAGTLTLFSQLYQLEFIEYPDSYVLGAADNTE